ncbi:MAG: penicillin acylase family protein, partial [Candidatus Kapaibacterium sp.]
MNLLQRLSATTVTVIIVVFTFIIFSLKIALRSNVEQGQEFHGKDVRSPIEIYRNSFGIPHIVAADEDDCFFALGFTHAQDRLWQMDLMRRVARGSTARIFGVSTLDADRFFRTLDISSIARRVESGISPQSRRALEGYA